MCVCVCVCVCVLVLVDTLEKTVDLYTAGTMHSILIQEGVFLFKGDFVHFSVY